MIEDPGRIPKRPFRDVVNAILCVSTGRGVVAAASGGLPPWHTVYDWFRHWKTRDVTERILDELRKQIRLAEDRDAEPSAGVIDMQSVKELTLSA